MSQLRRKTTKNKEDATKCLLHPPPCVGLIVLLLLPSALPFSHAKGVKSLATKLIAHWVERVKEPTFMLLLHNSNKVFAGAPE